jgi:glycopeptide antibiotics resistance protein
MKPLQKLIRAGLLGIAAVYAAALLKIVVLKAGFCPEYRSLQLIPFSFVADFFTAQTSLDVLLKNVLGNFAIFIPLGLLLAVFLRRANLRKVTAIGCGVSVAIEIFQYITGCGITDIDDVILNTLGAAAGAGIYALLRRLAKSRLRTEGICFAFLACFGCMGLLSLWLYAPSVLPAQVAYVNAEVFGAVAQDSYTLTARCSGVGSGAVQLEPGTAQPESYTAAQYPLSADAVLILQKSSYQYSPNGNIQKTTVTFSTVSEAELEQALCEHSGGFADLWLDESGSCTMLVLAVYEN